MNRRAENQRASARRVATEAAQVGNYNRRVSHSSDDTHCVSDAGRSASPAGAHHRAGGACGYLRKPGGHWESFGDSIFCFLVVGSDESFVSAAACAGCKLERAGLADDSRSHDIAFQRASGRRRNTGRARLTRGTAQDRDGRADAGNGSFIASATGIGSSPVRERERYLCGRWSSYARIGAGVHAAHAGDQPGYGAPRDFARPKGTPPAAPPRATRPLEWRASSRNGYIAAHWKPHSRR